MSGYLNNNSLVVANGMPFDIFYNDGSGFNAGLNVSCTNPTQALNNTYNVSISTRNGTIPHVDVSDARNQLHLHPVDAVELNTTDTENVIIGKACRFRDRIRIDGVNTIMQINNTAGSLLGRTSIDFVDDMGLVYEYEIRNFAETRRGWY